MYSANAIFVITDKGLDCLKNNDLPPSVFTSILRLVDGIITLETFAIFLKEHGDIKPLFKFLHNENFIARVNTVDEIKIAPAAQPQEDAPIDFIASDASAPIEKFEAKFFKQIVHQYITLNHPHVIVGVMTMFDSMTSKQDYANHRELYARLIAGDIIHSNQHMAEIDALLALPE